MRDILARLGQIVALVLTPVLLIAGMAATVAFHGILGAFLANIPLGDFLVAFLSVAMFIAVVILCIYWTRTQGFGLLDFNRV